MKQFNPRRPLWLLLIVGFIYTSGVLLGFWPANPWGSSHADQAPASYETLLASYERKDLITHYKVQDSLRRLEEDRLAKAAVKRKAEVRQIISKATDYEAMKPALALMDAQSPSLDAIPSIPPLKAHSDKGAPSVAGAGVDPKLSSKPTGRGITMAAPYGTPVYATLSGQVVAVIEGDSGRGKTVEIRNELGFKTRYAHLSNAVVNQNMDVHQGDVVGYVGRDGSTHNPQLYYEIIKNGAALYPKPFLSIRSQIAQKPKG